MVVQGEWAFIDGTSTCRQGIFVGKTVFLQRGSRCPGPDFSLGYLGNTSGNAIRENVPMTCVKPSVPELLRFIDLSGIIMFRHDGRPSLLHVGVNVVEMPGPEIMSVYADIHGEHGGVLVQSAVRMCVKMSASARGLIPGPHGVMAQDDSLLVYVDFCQVLEPDEPLLKLA